MGKAAVRGLDERHPSSGPTGVVAMACQYTEAYATWEAPAMTARDRQPEAREGQAGSCGVTEGFVVATKPGNAGGAKGPQFKVNVRRGAGPGDWR
jgi:hypothetical protein